MGISFEFTTASHIIFGAGSSQKIAEHVKQLGSRICLVTGKNKDRIQSIYNALETGSFDILTVSIPGEPNIPMLLDAINQARSFKADVVLSVGGGSTIDAGKVIAALLTNSGDLLDYLEVIGQGHPIQVHPVPCIAIPTTAGTGTEVTHNSVLISTEHRVKVSMRHAWMLPTLAIIDPVLTYSMPAEITASTGLDALTQLIEPFICIKRNPLTDGFCREGIPRIARSLNNAFHDGQDSVAREDMALASLLSGLALSNAKLGAVHGIAGPMGGMFDAPHGVICARLLPHVISANYNALKADGQNTLIRRFDELGQMLTGRNGSDASDAIDWIHAICQQLHIEPLMKFGVAEENFQAIIEKARRASSMKGNPVQLSESELWHILEMATFNDE